MTSEACPPFVIGLEAAACQRLAGVERHEIPLSGGLRREIRVALPKSYATSKRRRYPLVLLPDCDSHFGSAVEMSRLMSDTSEIRECILVGLPKISGDPAAEAAGRMAAQLGGEILAWCREHLRIEPGQVALFGVGTAATVVLHALLAGNDGIERFILGEHDLERATAVLRRFQGQPLRPRPGRRLSLTVAGGSGAAAWQVFVAALSTAAGGTAVSLRVLDDLAAGNVAATALLDGLRGFWGSGKEYGYNVTGLRHPAVHGLLEFLSPLFRRLVRPPQRAVDASNPQLLRSERMARNFEVFVAMPASHAAGSRRRYPMLLVLDANIEFSTVAETAARMAAAGEIVETIVVGLGTPRSEGPAEFGFRRFEEMSPEPSPDYDYSDDLGRIFRGLFAARGQDARERCGKAQDLLGFIANELLPQLQGLPIDPSDLGLLGHSAGGTFVGYALYQQNSPFTRYLAVSPGIGISGSWLMQQPDVPGVSPCAKQVVLALGDLEKANLFNRIAGIDLTEDFARRLQAQQPALALRCECLEGETHSSIYPRAVALLLATAYAHKALPAEVQDTSLDRPVAA